MTKTRAFDAGAAVSQTAVIFWRGFPAYVTSMAFIGAMCAATVALAASCALGLPSWGQSIMEAVVIVALLAFLTTLQVWSVAIAGAVHEGRRPTVVLCLDSARRHVLAVMGIEGVQYLWAGLLLLFTVAPLGFVIRVVTRDPSFPRYMLVDTVVQGALAIVSLLPLTAVASRWIAALPARVLEGARPMASIGRSLELTANAEWPLFSLVFLVLALASAVNLGLGLVGQFAASRLTSMPIVSTLAESLQITSWIVWITLTAVAATAIHGQLVAAEAAKARDPAPAPTSDRATALAAS